MVGSRGYEPGQRGVPPSLHAPLFPQQPCIAMRKALHDLQEIKCCPRIKVRTVCKVHATRKCSSENADSPGVCCAETVWDHRWYDHGMTTQAEAGIPCPSDSLRGSVVHVPYFVISHVCKLDFLQEDQLICHCAQMPARATPDQHCCKSSTHAAGTTVTSTTDKLARGSVVEAVLHKKGHYSRWRMTTA